MALVALDGLQNFWVIQVRHALPKRPSPPCPDRTLAAQQTDFERAGRDQPVTFGLYFSDAQFLIHGEKLARGRFARNPGRTRI